MVFQFQFCPIWLWFAPNQKMIFTFIHLCLLSPNFTGKSSNVNCPPHSIFIYGIFGICPPSPFSSPLFILPIHFFEGTIHSKIIIIYLNLINLFIYSFLCTIKTIKLIDWLIKYKVDHHMNKFECLICPQFHPFGQFFSIQFGYLCNHFGRKLSSIRPFPNIDFAVEMAAAFASIQFGIFDWNYCWNSEYFWGELEKKVTRGIEKIHWKWQWNGHFRRAFPLFGLFLRWKLDGKINWIPPIHLQIILI